MESFIFSEASTICHSSSSRYIIALFKQNISFFLHETLYILYQLYICKWTMKEKCQVDSDNYFYLVQKKLLKYTFQQLSELISLIIRGEIVFALQYKQIYLFFLWLYHSNSMYHTLYCYGVFVLRNFLLLNFYFKCKNDFVLLFFF